MALTLFGGTIQQPLNNAGAIMPGGSLTFYATGTLNYKTVYHDAAAGSAWTNPVVLDGNGRAIVFLNNNGGYDIVCKDAAGTVLWTLENVIAAAPVV